MPVSIKKLAATACVIGGLAYFVTNYTGNVIPEVQGGEETAESNEFGAKEAPKTQVTDGIGEKLSELIAKVDDAVEGQGAVQRKVSNMSQEQNIFKDKVTKSIEDLENEIPNLVNDAVSRQLGVALENIELPPAQIITESSSDDNAMDDLGLDNTLPSNGLFLKDLASEVEIPILSKPNSNGQPKTTNPESLNTIGDKPKKTSDEQSISSNAIVWYEADDIVFKTDSAGNVIESSYPVTFIDGKSYQTASLSKDPDTGEAVIPTPPSVEPESTVKPILTIPANSTLIDATATTAIIGRVPTDGKVKNSFRYKISVGHENLAANGYYVPGLSTMVMSGLAEGDMSMKCARGDIDSITYVFQDGTIRTATSDGKAGDTLGWISDEYGNPCIPGYYISDFPKYIATHGGIAGMVALGNGIASSQVTNVESTDIDGKRAVSEIITGDSFSYGVGKSISTMADTTSEIFEKRMEDAFDAVWLELGEKVAVHIEQEIHIDYDTKGRKLIYQENIEEYLQ